MVNLQLAYKVALSAVSAHWEVCEIANMFAWFLSTASPLADLIALYTGLLCT